MQVKIFKGKSKKSGKEFEALQIKIGEYSTLIFPTKIEMLYIKEQLRAQAHDEFQDEE